MPTISPQSEDLPFVATLEAAYETFLAELEPLEDAAFDPWPIHASYRGSWTVFPLLGLAEHAGIGERVQGNRRRCPRSWAVLESLPGLLRGGFSRMAPDTHIYRHADDGEDSLHYRCHLGLIVPDGPLLRIHREDGAHDDYRWAAGRCLVFWGGQEHEAANLGREPRTILLCDFDMAVVRAEAQR